MTTLDNLRTLKLELEANLKQEPSAERRDWIEGELQKIERALSFLDEVAKSTTSPPASK
jgi:hypothetical protein